MAMTEINLQIYQTKGHGCSLLYINENMHRYVKIHSRSEITIRCHMVKYNGWFIIQKNGKNLLNTHDFTNFDKLMFYIS